MTYKTDFPIFANQPDLTYLDSAATTQKLGVVIDRVAQFYTQENATIHRGLYPLSVSATDQYEAARAAVAHFIGSKDPAEIVFVRGATEGLNLLASSLSQTVQPGDEIIISDLEHHANFLPWQQIPGVIMKFAKITESGEIDLQSLEDLVSEKTKIVALSLCSNVMGSITPFSLVRKLLDRKGSNAPLIADAAQALPHFPVSVAELGCDALVFSGHKLYAPSGIGVLWGRRTLLEQLPPYQTGGDMIKTVTREGAVWNDLPWKFEAGTPNIEGALALATALEYLENIGMETVATHTAEISEYARAQFTTRNIKILGNPDPQSGIISFLVPDIHPHDVAETLGEQGVCIRAGHHCAAPLHDVLGIPASNRISIGLYTDRADIDRFFAALDKTVAFFHHV